MSVWTALDVIAQKAKTVDGMLEVYTATGSGVSSTDAPIPQSVDATPVGIVWIGSAEGDFGNAETVLFYPRLNVWFRATSAGAAYEQLAQFPDKVIAAFRTGITQSGGVTNCLIQGWDDPVAEVINNGQTYLVLSFRFKVLLQNFAHLYDV